jgi:hypothetical protein
MPLNLTATPFINPIALNIRKWGGGVQTSEVDVKLVSVKVGPLNFVCR